MDLTRIIIAAFIIAGGISLIMEIRDLHTHWDEVRTAVRPPWPLRFFISFLLYFLAPFGISDYALSTAIYTKTGWVELKKLPGTLGLQTVAPLLVMSTAFLGTIAVEPLTLIPFFLFQAIGSYVGPYLTQRISVKALRYIISFGLFISGVFVLLGQLNMLDFSHTAMGLHGWRLLVCWIASFFLGVVKTLGIATYPLTMGLVFLLGLNPLAAYPMMTGASAIGIPIVCRQFIRLNAYDRPMAFSGQTAGLLGALAGVYCMRRVNVAFLQWVILLVIFYAALDLLLKKEKPAETAGQ